MALRRIACLVGVALVTWIGVAHGQIDDGESLAVATLREAHQGTDNQTLLDLFRHATLTPAERHRIETCVAQLNDDAYEVREGATAELIEIGPAASAFLRKAENHPVLEVRRRVRRCLDKLGPAPTELLSAAAQIMAIRRPPGAVETMLAYLPDADDEQTTSDIETALAAFAFFHGRANPQLINALRDPQPARRVAAAMALCQAGGRRAVSLVRPLLQDADAHTRLRVAERLADQRQPDAIPVLIALSGQSADISSQADTYLRDLLGTAAPAVLAGATPANRQAMRTGWQRWWQAIQPASLVEQVRKGTPDEAIRRRAAELIARLGDDDFTVRERASEALAELGSGIVPLLKSATRNEDAEVAHRAATQLARLENGPANQLITVSTVRLMALTRPAGAASALLAYLPYAAEGPGLDEVQDALTVLASRSDKSELDRDIVRALSDPLPLRRRVAGVALARAAQTPPPALLRLLADPVADVRLNVGVALVEQKEPRAVPVLIALLGELPAEQVWQAHDLLRRLAGDEAPTQPPGAAVAERKRCQVAWQSWWDRRRDQIDMSRLDRPSATGGRLVAVCYDGYNGAGRIWEMGRNHKSRWEITQGLRGPIDAVMIGPDRVLIAEYNGHVSERDTHGKVLWEKPITGNPIAVQRLPNGHTFVATMSNIMEITAQGDQVYNHPAPFGNVTCARVLADGHIVSLSMDGHLTEMNRQGKQIRAFLTNSDGPNFEWRTFTVLPGGHYLLPRQSTGKVLEYDRKGKLIWRGAAPTPYAAVRLGNGRLMTVSMNTSLLAEVDAHGKTVWQEQLKGRPFMIRWR